MALRLCSECGKPFDPDEDWKSTCILCWKGAHNYPLNKSDLSFQRLQQAFSIARLAWKGRQGDHGKELYEARRLQEKAEAETLQLRLRLKHCERALREARAKSPASTPAPTGSLDPATIRKLIGLCHPDRHNNSETSNEITRWLLSQRKKR